MTDASDAGLARLEELGPYDPSADDARDQRAVYELLLDRGATVEEIAAAVRQRRLAGLVTTVVLLGPRSARLTPRQMAERVGISVDLVRRVWRTWGFSDAGPDDPLFVEEDAEVFRLVAAFQSLGAGEEGDLQMGRVIGAAMQRIADAGGARIRSLVEAPLRRGGAGDFTVARAYAGLAETTTPQTRRILDRVYVHHLAREALRQLEVTADISGVGASDLTVGFADLVGFTEMSQQLTMRELSQALSRFEERAGGVIVECGGRLVKVIGDAVMFAADEVTTACEAALGLAEAFRGMLLVPPLRVGVAAGEVLLYEGDLFGPVVNLASRAAGLARPGTVLATREVRERVAGNPAYGFRPIGARAVKGFEERVPLYALRRSRDGDARPAAGGGSSHSPRRR